MTKTNFIKKRLTVLAVAVTALLLSLGSAASAHVTVKPSEVTVASYQVFTVSVPNEKSITTASVKLVIPEVLKTVTPTQKAGWQVSLEKEDDRATVKSVTWSGSEIGDGLRDEFTFSAKTPADPTELQWKAYQTYSDGTVVEWDQAGENGHGHDGTNPNQGPFSVTRVVSEAEQTSSAEQSAADAKTAANRAAYIAVAGVVLGLAGVYLATRRTQ